MLHSSSHRTLLVSGVLSLLAARACSKSDALHREAAGLSGAAGWSETPAGAAMGGGDATSRGGEAAGGPASGTAGATGLAGSGPADGGTGGTAGAAGGAVPTAAGEAGASAGGGVGEPGGAGAGGVPGAAGSAGAAGSSGAAGAAGVPNQPPIARLLYEIELNEWVEVFPGDTVTRPLAFDINWDGCSSYDLDGTVREVWLYDGVLTELFGPTVPECIKEFTNFNHSPRNDLRAYLRVIDDRGAETRLEFIYRTE